MRFIHMESTRRAQMERLVSIVLAVWSGQWGRINHGERTVGSSQIAEPESIVRVKNLHGRLNQVVGTLSEKISAVLQKQVRTLVFVFCLLFGWFKSTGEGILSSLQSSYVQAMYKKKTPGTKGQGWWSWVGNEKGKIYVFYFRKIRGSLSLLNSLE